MSIRFKFTAVLLLLLLTSLSAFSLYAHRTFSEDKRLSISDLNASALRAVAAEVKLDVAARIHELPPLLARLGAEAKVSVDGLPKTVVDELVAVTVYRRAEKGFEAAQTFANTDLLGRRRLSPEVPSRINREHAVTLESVGDQTLELENRSLVNGGEGNAELGVVSIVLGGKWVGDDRPGTVVVADYLNEFLRARLERSDFSDTFLVFRDGRLLAHANLKVNAKYAGAPFPHPALRGLAQAVPVESLEVTVSGEPYYANVAETGIRDLYALSQIRRRDALAPLVQLDQKAALLCGIVVSLALILGLLFGSRVTWGLRQLAEAAGRYGAGEWGFKLDVRSRDEIGAVGRKLQWMATQVQELTEQSVAAARDAEEGEAARALQSTLFCSPRVESGACDVAAHFEPSPHGGTNFWDAHASGPYLTAVVGEASAKGVHGAVATAMARACFNSIQAPDAQPWGPEPYLSALNRLLLTMSQGKLTLTACAVQLNLETGELKVASAGHRGPFLLRRADGALTAEPVATDGPLLGAGADSKYRAVTVKLALGEGLVLHTNGVTAALNDGGSAWGEAGLLAAIAEGRAAAAAGSSEVLRGRIEAALRAHTGDLEAAEDTTFVLVQWTTRHAELLARPEPEAPSIWSGAGTSAPAPKAKDKAKPRKPERAPVAPAPTEADAILTEIDEPLAVLGEPEMDMEATAVLDRAELDRRASVLPRPDLDEEMARRDAFLHEGKDLTEKDEEDQAA